MQRGLVAFILVCLFVATHAFNAAFRASSRPRTGLRSDLTMKGKGGKVNNVHGAIAKEGTKNRGRAAAMKAYYGDAGEPVGDNLALMSKEGLMLEINELKKKNKLLIPAQESLHSRDNNS